MSKHYFMPGDLVTVKDVLFAPTLWNVPKMRDTGLSHNDLYKTGEMAMDGVGLVVATTFSDGHLWAYVVCAGMGWSTFYMLDDL